MQYGGSRCTNQHGNPEVVRNVNGCSIQYGAAYGRGSIRTRMVPAQPPLIRSGFTRTLMYLLSAMRTSLLAASPSNEASMSTNQPMAPPSA